MTLTFEFSSERVSLYEEEKVKRKEGRKDKKKKEFFILTSNADAANCRKNWTSYK